MSVAQARNGGRRRTNPVGSRSPGLALGILLTATLSAADAQDTTAPPTEPAPEPTPATCPCPPPPPPPPIWTGSLGAGLALTSGNTDSESFNLSFAARRDSGGRHVLKLDALYLRGKAGEQINVDKGAAGARDDYRLTPRLSAFGELRYRRDRFQNLAHAWEPTIGLGLAVVATERLGWSVDAGAGYLSEEYRDGGDDASATLRVGEVLTWQISAGAKLSHLATATTKLDDTGDVIVHAELGVVAALTARSELKVALVDDYRTEPLAPGLERNDLSTLLAVLYTF